MTTDFKHKEPSKNEKLIYELFMQMQSMEKGLWSTSSLVISLAMLTNQDPEKIAELLVNGEEKMKDYSKKVNDAIKKLEEAKGPNKEHSHEGHKHDSEASNIDAGNK